MSAEEIAVWIAAILGVVAGYCMGYSAAMSTRRAREQSIRTQAYQEGRRSVIDEHIERLSMMAPELFTTHPRPTKETK